MAQTVADRIKMVLEEKGIDHQDLAEKIGVNQSTAWRWIEGERCPQKRSLQAIANAYGYRPAWLASGKGDRYAKASSKGDNNALGNAGVIFRYADTGEIFFWIRFPEYMPVVNAHVVDVQRPGPDDTKAEPVKQAEDVG